MFAAKVKNVIKKQKKMTYITILTGIVLVSAVVWLSIANVNNGTIIAQQKKDISELQALMKSNAEDQSRKLSACEADAKAKDLAHNNELAALKDQVAAFAKQAAVCEVLRKKLNKKR